MTNFTRKTIYPLNFSPLSEHVSYFFFFLQKVQQIKHWLHSEKTSLNSAFLSVLQMNFSSLAIPFSFVSLQETRSNSQRIINLKRYIGAFKFFRLDSALNYSWEGHGISPFCKTFDFFVLPSGRKEIFQVSHGRGWGKMRIKTLKS